jgi:hypothetical protein
MARARYISMNYYSIIIVRRKWRKLKKKTDMAESLILPTLQITVNQVDITAVQIKSETERR